MRVNIGKTCMNFGNAMRVSRRLSFFKKRCSLLVRFHDDFDQCVFCAGCFLSHLTDARISR
ncbi:hypothetical protein D9M72_586170 [compost metagenome]